MKPAKVAAEAIRFRISTIRRAYIDSEAVDVEAMGAASVTAGKPEVYAALRIIANAWHQAGLEQEALAQPWSAKAAEAFRNRSDIIDAIDVIAVAAGTSGMSNTSSHSSSSNAT